MGKYLKNFETEAQYSAYISAEPFLPNVSRVEDGLIVHFNPIDTAITYDYVDLGLPSGILWATKNVGASSPEQGGNFYAYGETQTKNEYTIENYSLATSTPNGYVIQSISEYTSEYDAATAEMGSQWKTPSMENVLELLQNTTTSLTISNGTSGITFTSNANGNTMFIPIAGGTMWSGTSSTISDNVRYVTNPGSPVYMNYISSLLSTQIDPDGFGSAAFLVIGPNDEEAPVGVLPFTIAEWNGSHVRGIIVPEPSYEITGSGTYEDPFVIPKDVALNESFARRVKSIFDEGGGEDPIYYCFSGESIIEAWLSDVLDDFGEPTGEKKTEFSAQNEENVVNPMSYDDPQDVREDMHAYVTYFIYSVQGDVTITRVLEPLFA